MMARRFKTIGQKKRKKARDTQAAGKSRLSKAGRAALLTAAALLLIVPVLLIAHPISYVPLVAAVLMVIVSYAYLQVLKKAVGVSVNQMATSCERGQDAGLSVDVFNKSVLPCARLEMRIYVTDLFGDYDETHTVSCSLRPRENTSIPLNVRFAHLGTYHAGVSDIVVYDLLGLFSAKLGDGARRAVAVRPRKMDMTAADVTQVSLEEAANMLKAVPSDDVNYASVREYRYGDPLKAVHWNLSSKNPDGTMYTRLYEAYVNPSLAIVVDPYSPEYGTDDLMALFDGIVESAAALSNKARQAGVDAEVHYIDRSGNAAIARIASETDTEELVMHMRRITEESTVGSDASATDEVLRTVGLRSHGFGNIALLTSRPDSDLLQSLTEVHVRGRNALAFAACPRMMEGRERDTFLAPFRALSSSGVPYYVVESNEVETRVMTQ